jgi:hypothetical protein
METFLFPDFQYHGIHHKEEKLSILQGVSVPDSHGGIQSFAHIPQTPFRTILPFDPLPLPGRHAVYPLLHQGSTTPAHSAVSGQTVLSRTFRPESVEPGV